MMRAEVGLRRGLLVIAVVAVRKVRRLIVLNRMRRSVGRAHGLVAFNASRLTYVRQVEAARRIRERFFTRRGIKRLQESVRHSLAGLDMIRRRRRRSCRGIIASRRSLKMIIVDRIERGRHRRRRRRRWSGRWGWWRGWRHGTRRRRRGYRRAVTRRHGICACRYVQRLILGLKLSRRYGQRLMIRLRLWLLILERHRVG